MILREFLKLLGTSQREGRNLSVEEAETVFARILEGVGSDAQVAAFLMALRWKGETAAELVGLARAARGHATLPSIPSLVAIGSPHDGKRRSAPLNAASGIIAAACGLRVLQITDPAPRDSSRLTSADVLAALSVQCCTQASEAEQRLLSAGFASVSASAMLPGLVRLSRIRDELGVRVAIHTIEKLILPHDSIAVVGVAKGPFLGLAAEVLVQLGHQRAVVVQGEEGGIDPFPNTVTRRIEVRDGMLLQSPIVPEDYGFHAAPHTDPHEGHPSRAARAIEALLRDHRGPLHTSATLGAAQLLAIAHPTSFPEAVDQARTAITSGLASAKLEELRNP